MDRKALVSAINSFAEKNNLGVAFFAVTGTAGSFLLNDIDEFKSIRVDIALSSGFDGVVFHTTVDGLRFNCERNPSAWASYTPIPDSDKFVVSTRGRKRK